MDINKAINVVNQYLAGFRPNSEEFNEALHVLLNVAYTVTQPNMNLPDDINNELHKPIKVHFDYNAVACERCKKVITDGRIIRKTDDPTKGICFDCC